MEDEFTIIIERGALIWSAHVPDLPGCTATGRSRAEAKRMIGKAIVSHIEGLAAAGVPVPRPSVEAGTVRVKRSVGEAQPPTGGTHATGRAKRVGGTGVARALGTPLRVFAPERWGAVEFFVHFPAAPGTRTRTMARHLNGILDRFRRSLALREIAKQWAPRLGEDWEQLEAIGYTPMNRATELAALVEACIAELYSSLDCAARFLGALYHYLRGVPSNSTRKLFLNAREGRIDDRVPLAIRSALAGALWYDGFRATRDAFTHLDPGTCDLSRATGRVAYRRHGYGAGPVPPTIEDVFQQVEEWSKLVNGLLGAIFSALKQLLPDDETQQLCGMYEGRGYTRYVRPSEAVDSSSGRCDSYTWFELPENPGCPWAASCGAYGRRDG